MPRPCCCWPASISLGNKVKEAEDLYRKAIAAQPDDTQPYLQLIQLFGSRQSYDQALELADSALAKFPG